MTVRHCKDTVRMHLAFPSFSCPCSITRLRLPIKGFGDRIQSPGQSVWICSGLYKYLTCLIFFTTVTNPLSPLPTNSPVSGFLRPPQTHIDTIRGCLRHPATLKLRILSPRRPSQTPTKVGHCCLRKSIIRPRRPEESSDQSGTQSVYPQKDRV